jgi:hypothetical protein
MKKAMCMMLLLGAVGFFGLSQRSSFRFQPTTRFGSPSGKEQTAHVTADDKVGYIVLGAFCMGGGLYLLAKIRNEGS